LLQEAERTVQAEQKWTYRGWPQLPDGRCPFPSLWSQSKEVASEGGWLMTNPGWEIMVGVRGGFVNWVGVWAACVDIHCWWVGSSQLPALLRGWASHDSPSSMVRSQTGSLHSPVLFRSRRNPWTWTQYVVHGSRLLRTSKSYCGVTRN
jgi:hypothetical protein